MKTVAVLRSNPRDAALGRLLGALGARYRLECLVWDRTGDFEPTFTSDTTSYLRFRVRSGYHDAGTLAKLTLFQAWCFAQLARSRCDAIHAIDLDTAIPGLLAARMKRVPFVYHCLDPYYAALPESWPRVLGRMARALENRVISSADLFVITDLLRMPQHEGAHPQQVLELPNVPELEHVTPTKRAEGGFRVGYIGSLVEGRNLETIIEACGELRDQGVQLVIGGFGPLKDEVAKWCTRHSNVNFTSWIPAYSDLLQLESTFDAFVHITDPRMPSQRWVSPNKLFTSMAFGRPIIVGEGTLAAQRVRSFRNGIAVPYASKDALKAALLALKNHPELPQKMGENGRSEFEKNWNPQTFRARLLGEYDATLARSRCSAAERSRA